VNYHYAGLLATKMFDMLKQEPVSFQKHYAALLREGFHAAPEELLRSFFGRDVSQRQLVESRHQRNSPLGYRSPHHKARVSENKR
jgi:oligoendopeptidase F